MRLYPLDKRWSNAGIGVGCLCFTRPVCRWRKVEEGIIFWELNGAPDRIRTCDLWFRRPTLYPAELRAHLELIPSLAKSS